LFTPDALLPLLQDYFTTADALPTPGSDNSSHRFQDQSFAQNTKTTDDATTLRYWLSEN
jgi:hypothetical protein